METSISMKTTAQNGTKNTTTLSYVNPNSTPSEMKTYAQKLASLTSDSYTSSTRIDKTSLDESADKLPRNIALWRGDEYGENYVTVQAAMSNADKEHWYDIRYDGFDPCYVMFGNGGTFEFETVFGGASVQGSTQYAGVAWQLGKAEPFMSNNTITIYVPESDTHQSATLEISVTGGNG